MKETSWTAYSTVEAKSITMMERILSDIKVITLRGIVLDKANCFVRMVQSMKGLLRMEFSMVMEN